MNCILEGQVEQLLTRLDRGLMQTEIKDLPILVEGGKNGLRSAALGSSQSHYLRNWGGNRKSLA